MERVENIPLEVERVIPDFVLPSLEGKQVSPREYRQRANLVLVYLNLDRCTECVNYLKDFADNYHVYRDLETEILAIIPQPLSEVQSSVGTLGLPFPVLLDQQGEVARVYLGDQAGMGGIGAVFVTDRFGELRTEMVIQSPRDLPGQQSILDWLNLIETECPECDGGDKDFWPR